MTRALHMLASDARVGLPLSYCPTCCRTGAGRLRIIMLRSPLARMQSYYHKYWSNSKGHLLPGGFDRWVEEVLGSGARNSTLFEADDLDHVAPTFREPHVPSAESVVF